MNSSQQQTSMNQRHEEKIKIIQQQLALILHAQKCDNDPSSSGSKTADQQPACTESQCANMKKVLAHMSQCSDGRRCVHSNCASSRQIIIHWEKCTKPDCNICSHFRNNDLQQQQEKQSITALIKQTCQSEPSSSSSWQERLTSDIRMYLIPTLMKAKFPANNPSDAMELSDLMNKAECDVYERAKDMEEYFHLLGERIYNTQKEFDEKQTKMMKQSISQSSLNSTDAVTKTLTTG